MLKSQPLKGWSNYEHPLFNMTSTNSWGTEVLLIKIPLATDRELLTQKMYTIQCILNPQLRRNILRKHDSPYRGKPSAYVWPRIIQSMLSTRIPWIHRKSWTPRAAEKRLLQCGTIETAMHNLPKIPLGSFTWASSSAASTASGGKRDVYELLYVEVSTVSLTPTTINPFESTS